jgi:hypothetical protein
LSYVPATLASLRGQPSARSKRYDVAVAGGGGGGAGAELAGFGGGGVDGVPVASAHSAASAAAAWRRFTTTAAIAPTAASNSRSFFISTIRGVTTGDDGLDRSARALLAVADTGGPASTPIAPGADRSTAFVVPVSVPDEPDAGRFGAGASGYRERHNLKE